MNHRDTPLENEFSNAGQAETQRFFKLFSLLPTVVSWDGRNNAGERATSGVYFLKLETEDYRETRQLLLTK